MISVYEQRGIERGIEQGIEQGIERGIEQGLIEGTRRTLLRLLEARFGTLSTETHAKLQSITDKELLDALTLRFLTAVSLAELGLEGTVFLP